MDNFAQSERLNNEKFLENLEKLDNIKTEEFVNKYLKDLEIVKENIKRKKFEWFVKDKSTDFIVKEILDLNLLNFSREINKTHKIYLLIKKFYNTKDIADKFKLSYAGLKDKNALTYQYLSSSELIIDEIKSGNLWEEGRAYYLKLIGSADKKIKTGFLKGNKFFIRNKLNIRFHFNYPIFLNYFDTQRLSKNWQDGLKILISEDTKKIKRNWLLSFKIDAFLSYLWNRSLENLFLFLFFTKSNKGKIKFSYLTEYNEDFLIFDLNYLKLMSSLFGKLKLNYWPILGYKSVKLDSENIADIREKIHYLFYKLTINELKREICNFSSNLNGYGLICSNKELFESLDLRNLLDKLKNLKLKGDYRRIFALVNDFKTNEKYLSFDLNKGSYATMFLKHLYFESLINKNKI